MTWVGWIIADPDPEGADMQLLRGLGIQLGPFDTAQGSFENCLVTAAQFDQLDPHWGQVFWGLQPHDGTA